MEILTNKYALYCRVSTVDQKTENQRIRLEEYAKQNQFEYDLYEETESTRKTRPVKQSLIQKIRAGHYKGVIIYKLDRWARSSTELILEAKEFIDKGIGFLSLSESLDFTTSSGKLHFQILSAFAEFERSLISERTKEGIRRAKLSGKQLGRPFGSKDTKQRRKSGYILREALKKKQVDEKTGIYKDVSEYLDRKSSPK